jgi:hypothetical protein
MMQIGLPNMRRETDDALEGNARLLTPVVLDLEGEWWAEEPLEREEEERAN